MRPPVLPLVSAAVSDILDSFGSRGEWMPRAIRPMDANPARRANLGKPMGLHRQSGLLYMREFEDGFVVVNPGAKSAAGVVVSPVPGIRLLTDANFRPAEEVQPASHLHLPARRGVILLKEGRKAGNEDNVQN